MLTLRATIPNFWGQKLFSKEGEKKFRKIYTKAKYLKQNAHRHNLYKKNYSMYI